MTLDPLALAIEADRPACVPQDQTDRRDEAVAALWLAERRLAQAGMVREANRAGRLRKKVRRAQETT